MEPKLLPNEVFVSSLLPAQYLKFYSELTNLKTDNLNIKLLNTTKDIWCRDYMPVQATDGTLIQFRYEPSYLKEYEHLRSLQPGVNKANCIKAAYSKINLDGGNVVHCEDCVIISDRIFSENWDWDHNTLIKELEHLLQAEVLIFPSMKSDMTGHADGMVRFYDSNTLLLTDTKVEYKYWQKAVDTFLNKYQFQTITIPSFIYKAKGIKPENAIGCYINFIELNDLIIVPIFECEGNKDTEVMALFRKLYPKHQVQFINAFEIAKEGGVLNCISWNV